MTVKISLLFTSLFFLVTGNAAGQVPDWYLKLKKVVIFKTDRQSIESIFNKSAVYLETVLPFYTVVQYDTPDGDLEVYYSNGLCTENKDSDWNVNKNNVLSIKFEPHKFVKPSKLKINLRGFNSVKSSDTANISYKRNGTRIGVLFKKIILIEFSPTKEQNDMFQCPE